MSFKQFCSPVAAVTGPCNCVVYRDILLLKAHSCSRDAAPKHSSACGFVLTNLPHTSARGPFAQCVRLVCILVVAYI